MERVRVRERAVLAAILDEVCMQLLTPFQSSALINPNTEILEKITCISSAAYQLSSIIASLMNWRHCWLYHFIIHKSHSELLTGTLLGESYHLDMLNAINHLLSSNVQSMVS